MLTAAIKLFLAWPLFSKILIKCTFHLKRKYVHLPQLFTWSIIYTREYLYKYISPRAFNVCENRLKPFYSMK